MTPTEIASFLVPYIEHTLPETLLTQISTYLNLLLRWNARTNLTSIRTPEEIITRHFGESLFAAQKIFPAGKSTASVADIGSGAGFPGVPIKLWAPQIHLTLIESQQMKATFLREVMRALDLSTTEVQSTRAEALTKTFDVATLRAVERFEKILPTAITRLRPGGRLALLISQDQIPIAKTLASELKWENPQEIPNSRQRVLQLATTPNEPAQ
jgi:16S rRNA (guanine527-N7)-methyltransferase